MGFFPSLFPKDEKETKDSAVLHLKQSFSSWRHSSVRCHPLRLYHFFHPSLPLCPHPHFFIGKH